MNISEIRNQVLADLAEAKKELSRLEELYDNIDNKFDIDEYDIDELDSLGKEMDEVEEHIEELNDYLKGLENA